MENRDHSDDFSGILVFDIEGNGLLDKITKLHCITMIDPVTNQKWGAKPNEIEEALDFMSRADVLVGHNIVGFDIPAIKKLYPKFQCGKAFDTFTLASMLAPNRMFQSLDSWGRELGNLKDDFGKTADWSVFTDEMYEYCFQDTSVTVDLYKHLCEMAGFDYKNPPAFNVGGRVNG